MRLNDWLILLLGWFFDYRFLNRVLGAKFPLAVTLPAFLIYNGLFGYVNMRLPFAKTVLGNAWYFCAGGLLLNRLLYHGRFSKLAFYSVLLSCSDALMGVTLFALSSVFGNDYLWQLAVIYGGTYAWIALRGALLEYAGRRLQCLRYDFPAGYPLCLLATAFVCIISFVMMRFWPYAVGSAPDLSYLLSSAFIAAGSAVMVLMLVTVDRQMSLQLDKQRAQLQAAHYKSQAGDWKQTARVRHDMKNHVLCLDGLLREGKTDQALCYMETLEQTVEWLGEYVRTGNDFVDAIVNEKRAEALVHGIAFTIEMSLPAESRITPP